MRGLGWKLWGPALLVVLVGGVAGYAIDGSQARSVEGDDSTRVIVSPWITLASQQDQQADEILFEARLGAGQELVDWRLAVLDIYEGGVWKFAGDFEPWSDREPGESSSEAVKATVTLAQLEGIWLPVPGLVQRVGGPHLDLTWNSDTGAIVFGPLSEASPGVRYSVEALDETQSAALWPAPRDSARALPNDPELDALLSEAVAISTLGTTEPLDQLDALVEHQLRAYRLDSSIAFRLEGGIDPTVRFLRSAGGSSQGFVSSFALAARKLGYASRVVVGFESGDIVEFEAGYVDVEVQGRHAKAWPEVYLEDLGWIAFDPLPIADYGTGNLTSD